MLKILRTHWQIPLTVTALVLLAALPLLAECFYYSNSRPAYVGGMSVCAYTGQGCTECSQESGSCVTNGSSCTPQPFVRSPNP